LKVGIVELNRVNQRLKPRYVLEMMLKTGIYGCARDKSVTDALISGHAASGVKLAGRQYRLLFGTREVAVALLPAKGTGVSGCHETAAADQVVVAVKLSKGSGAKGLACSYFIRKLQPVMG
jgi:hypothetical protein